MITTIDQVPTIAGKHGGKKVHATQEVAHKYDALESLANKGNHWAMLAVKEIKSLTSGRINNTNTFVSINHHINEDEFYLVLPGCKVQAFRRSDDSYFINSIIADLSFHSSQETGEKPGLFLMKNHAVDGNWIAEYLEGGAVKGEGTDIPIGISDRYNSIVKSATIVNAHIQASPYQDKRSKEFNLFFTPGKKTIGGLLHLKEAFAPTKAKSLQESAHLLAETMIKTKEAKLNVVWVSQRGGSGILTQAMNIVNEKGIKLGQEQKIFLSHPTTRHIKAYNLSRDLDMGTDRDFSSHNPINISEFIGGINIGGELNLINERQKQEGTYGWTKASWDSGKFVLSGEGVSGTVKKLAAAAAIGSAFAPASAILAAFGIAKIAAVTLAATGVAASNIGPASQYPSLTSFSKTKIGA